VVSWLRLVCTMRPHLPTMLRLSHQPLKQYTAKPPSHQAHRPLQHSTAPHLNQVALSSSSLARHSFTRASCRGRAAATLSIMMCRASRLASASSSCTRITAGSAGPSWLRCGEGAGGGGGGMSEGQAAEAAGAGAGTALYKAWLLPGQGEVPPGAGVVLMGSTAHDRCGQGRHG
jgi:hypothetical protein